MSSSSRFFGLGGGRAKVDSPREDVYTRVRRSPRYVNLAARVDLMDTWQLEYFKADKAPVSNDIYRLSGDKQAFQKQLAAGDHHLESFYQGLRKADHTCLITGNYHLDHKMVDRFEKFGDRVWFMEARRAPGPPRYAKLWALPKTDDEYIKEGAELKSPDHMLRYPWMLLVGSSAVDMDDLLRFASSLLTNNSGAEDFKCIGHDNCNPVKMRSSMPEVLGTDNRFFDIWSHGSGETLSSARLAFRGEWKEFSSKEARVRARYNQLLHQWRCKKFPDGRGGCDTNHVDYKYPATYPTDVEKAEMEVRAETYVELHMSSTKNCSGGAWSGGSALSGGGAGGQSGGAASSSSAAASSGGASGSRSHQVGGVAGAATDEDEPAAKRPKF